jgi:hypothetical protein
MWQSKDLRFRLTDCVPLMPYPGVFVSESLGLKVRYWPLVDIPKLSIYARFRG